MAYFRQSKRRTALFLAALLNQPCCAGLTVKMQQQVTRSLQPPYDELVEQLPAQRHLGMDESPTKEGLHKAWLWTAVAGTFTVFGVRLSRAATLLEEWLGETFDGVITCDRAKMYWAHGRLQWCWAHLKRDFQALVDSDDGRAKRLGHDLMRPTRELFHQWARYRDGTLTRRGWLKRMQPIRHEIDALLLRGAFSDQARLRGMCGPLYDYRDRLWTFIEVEGIEPTNNASERTLRHAVIWRKLSFGTQKLRRQPLRGDHADRHRNLSPAKPKRLRLRHPSRRRQPRRPARTITAPQGVNDYSFAGGIGPCKSFCVSRAGECYLPSLGMRPSNRMAKWLRASFQLRIGIVHFLAAS